MTSTPQISDEEKAVSGGRLPPERQLTDGRNKIERIAQQSKGLIEDIKAWFDLKIKLTRLEIQAELEARRDEAVIIAAVALLGLLALVFGLTALAWGLGAWLGHPAWGFLVVTVLLLLAAGILWYAKGPGRKKKQEVVVEPKA